MTALTLETLANRRPLALRPDAKAADAARPPCPYAWRTVAVGDLRIRFVVELCSWSSNRAVAFSTTGANMVSRTKERARDLRLGAWANTRPGHAVNMLLG